MEPSPLASLNDSGAGGDERAIVVSGGATHQGLKAQTSSHAHYAWKLHVGVDAPVWLTSPTKCVPAGHEAHVLLIPPNFEHQTGGVGWSVALFVEPGSRGTPFRNVGGPSVIEGNAARAIRARCAALLAQPASDAASMFEETVSGLVNPGRHEVDVRVRRALRSIASDPSIALAELAASLGVSLDRLTHMVSQSTGAPLRRHVLWQRLLRVLSGGTPRGALARVAQDAGFADHAHMTRTFRRLLGRAPSEFRAPPVVLAPWVPLSSRHVARPRG